MERQVKELKNPLIREIQDWYAAHARGRKAVIDVTGGKNDAVCAALYTAALGNQQIMGVLMPNGSQRDLPDSYQLVDHLEIPSMIINIAGAVSSIHTQLNQSDLSATQQADALLLPGIRAAVLQTVAKATNSIVMDVHALPRGWTRLSARDKTELGLLLGLPRNLVERSN